MTRSKEHCYGTGHSLLECCIVPAQGQELKGMAEMSSYCPLSSLPPGRVFNDFSNVNAFMPLSKSNALWPPQSLPIPIVFLLTANWFPAGPP